MGLIFTLKMLGDLALYLALAAPIGRLFGLERAPVLPALALAACCGLSFWLGQRGRPALRLAPLALMPLCAALAGGRVAPWVLLPAAGYCAFTCAKGLFYEDHPVFRGRFLLAVKVLPLFALLMLALDRPALEGLMLPFVLLYLPTSVFLLQLLRQPEEVLRQRRFRLLSLAMLAGAALLGLALSSPVFLGAAVALAGAAYRYVLAPILVAVAYFFVLIVWLIAPLFSWLKGRRGEQPPLETDTGGNLEQFTQEFTGGPGGEMLRQVLVALVIVGLLVLAFLLLRRMLGQRRPGPGAGPPAQTRTAARAERPEHARTPGRRTPRGQVRAAFRKLLLLLKSQGIPLMPDTTSLTAARLAARLPCPAPEALPLRELYIAARYSGREITREEARAARAHLAALRARVRKAADTSLSKKEDES